MADRAEFLARTLISRTSTLAAFSREGNQPAKPNRAERTALIEKVFAVELGVTDGATISLVEAALPQHLDERARDRDIATLAEFFRQHLARQLAEA
jgi:hypothetical protein